MGVLGVKQPQRSPSLDGFLEDPIDAFAGSLTRMNGIESDALQDLQRDALRTRFTQLRNEIPLLRRVADELNVQRVDTLDDVVPLLFDHAFYKSYPASLIDRKRFADLTRWLSRLTTVDLTGFDAGECRCLDDWFMQLDAQTPLRVCHSSGTSGSFSLVPWSQAEFDTLGAAFAAVFIQDFGTDEDCRQTAPIEVLFPYFRHGSAMVTRLNDAIAAHVAKGEEHFHAALPSRLSSDVMYLAGRLRDATAKGTVRQLNPDPTLLARKEEFDTLLSAMPQLLLEFLDRVTTELAGRRIFTVAVWHTVHNLALAGLAAGRRDVFAPDSVLALGGGAKGMVQPDGWEDDVVEFFGAKRIRPGYGMSEITLAARECDHGRFHFNPWLIPFVLDSQTGAPLPRSGSVTGRAAFFDLAVKTRWGGFITGDKVKVHYDPCPCGQTTPGCERDIERFGAARDGEDKITCAATDAAHRETVEFLSSI
ncbi:MULTISPECIES: hypothetical protein [Mycobacterium]|uniref:hypothetical protein n=1 Tax=Mycobacterium TaxID=1763 RepID=UPI001EEFC5FD|nr:MULTISPECIES: hypothetical protein [Mycobacterium]BDB44205.1 hypothetical protein IWGMT90018_46510 [Mycobacterium kiyosense]BDE15742.1 hypothetical protein MKCMC460_46020 [Mycobacterium sp. 20KCMC460]GLB87397.1 hypothetical protein SRL2020130_02140 [Mycobacterium kiyosense]GLB99553.1 hypothetical protein SRL2020400_01450 [Mycobacterium kiyosense]GLC06472.1 hypothetical protein SRL2020411_11180 [Mycobacterium kiyosense]